MLNLRYLANHEYEAVVQRITDVVEASFKTRPMPSGVITEREAERRVEICAGIWNTLVGELRWTPERTMDHLAPFLTAILDGGRLGEQAAKHSPMARDASAMWAPEKLNEIEPERRLSALAVGGGAILGSDEGGDNGN